MIAWCAGCGDQSYPVEYNEPSPDPDEPWFCSDLCEGAHSVQVELERIYGEARHGGAPVF